MRDYNFYVFSIYFKIIVVAANLVKDSDLPNAQEQLGTPVQNCFVGLEDVRFWSKLPCPGMNARELNRVID